MSDCLFAVVRFVFLFESIHRSGTIHGFLFLSFITLISMLDYNPKSGIFSS